MKNSLWQGLILILVLALASSLLGEYLNQSWVDHFIKGHGIQGILLFLGLGALFTATGLSRQALALLAGYGFGFVYGLLWAEIASLLGCLIAFFYARYWAAASLKDRYPHRLEQINRFISDRPFSKILFIRLLPVGSNLLTNLAAGISNIRLLPFLAASAIGYLPQTLVFSLVGSGVRVDSQLQFALAALLFSLSAVLGYWLYKKQPASNIINA